MIKMQLVVELFQKLQQQWMLYLLNFFNKSIRKEKLASKTLIITIY